MEIDPETGQIFLDALTAYDDVGNAINPMMVEGQVHGGIVQSLGQAFMEEAGDLGQESPKPAKRGRKNIR